ncbi:MAG: CopG family transcriptional regulator [Caulobacteraceae bacterium]
MKPELAIFEDFDEADDAAAIAEARAEIAAGQFVSHEATKAWLLSWGAPGELAPPQVGD